MIFSAATSELIQVREVKANKSTQKKECDVVRICNASAEDSSSGEFASGYFLLSNFDLQRNVF
jgi:hypothetical protein